MTLLLRTVEAFPLGRTTSELLALLDVDFEPRQRAAILAELDSLCLEGRIRLGRDGRWTATIRSGVQEPPSAPDRPRVPRDGGQPLLAVPARFSSAASAPEEDQPARQGGFDPAALLRYYRAALRSDPRGATTETEDRHGISWLLITGSGPLVPATNEVLRVVLTLDSLPGTFREAIARRDANESTLAVGWPMAVTRKSGIPVVVPVGLIPAEWHRTDDTLELAISTDDVLVNPDWLRLSARSLAWSETSLRAHFSNDNGTGLSFAEFRARLREAAASALRGKLDGTAMISELDIHFPGLFDLPALFLPTESSFTAGAVRDLDRIATWPDHVRRGTALGALFEGADNRAAFDVLNASPLNAEQIDGVAQACCAPLTIVTGPPGTGKSQAITAMAASVMMAGGSVLLASKNHQALNAVEERLGDLAPDAHFLVRTLDPAREIDNDFRSALQTLLNAPARAPRSVRLDESAALSALAVRRLAALATRRRVDELRCELAEIIERILLRKGSDADPTPSARDRWWRAMLGRLFGRRPMTGPLAQSATLQQLKARQAALQSELAGIDIIDDPVALSEELMSRTQVLLPLVLSERASLNEEARHVIGNALADLELAGEAALLHRNLSEVILRHRPLWLASILGTPKRIPLEPALFDLVIFDEASQCDIASA